MVLLKSSQIPMGTSAPHFSLKDVFGKEYSLPDFGKAGVFVVVFMCNHCPYVQAVWDRLVELQKRYKDDGVQFVGINPNLHPDYPEETIEKMREYYDRYSMNFPYLQDDTQEVARSYGAQCTPDIFVYNNEKKLVYHGRIDDNWQESENVKNAELSDAIRSLLNGKIPSDPQNPSMGCSIKWKD